MSDFMVIPAIDILGGKCVRLRQGKYSEETIYANDPLKVAQKWEKEGAKYLHVVDLDGAREGEPVNSELIIQLASAVKIPVQTGGGVRTEEQIRLFLDSGIRRVIMGTAACASENTIALLARKFGNSLAVSIDVRHGLVQVRGWTDTTSLKAIDLGMKLVQTGIKTYIYTDTLRDGMLMGPNVNAITEFCRSVSGTTIASGGISSAADIAKLRSLNLPNLAGVIVGKALYEGKIALKDCQAETNV